jgi:hypothetical protein
MLQSHRHHLKALSAVLQPVGLCFPLLNELRRLLPPLLPQRNEYPKPRSHLQEAPREHDAVVQRVAVAHQVVGGSWGHETALFECVCVARKYEQKHQADGCLRAPVFVGQLFVHGYGGEVGEADECEEDCEEGEGGGGRREFARRGL